MSWSYVELVAGDDIMANDSGYDSIKKLTEIIIETSK